MKKIFFTLFICASVTCNFALGQILQPGYALLACKPDASGVTLGLKDIRNLGTLWNTTSNRATNQITTPLTSGPNGNGMWTTTNFSGLEIFSTSIDQISGTIYASSTRLYTSLAPGPGDLGAASVPAKIFKIDASTGVVSTLTTLTGDWGIGYIDFDGAHNQIFATNMDDGKIYRVNATTGNTLSSFDPLTTDNGTNTLPALGDRILGVAYNPVNNRVYYSVWGEDAVNAGGTNTLRSIGLTAAGNFDVSTDKLEITTPDLIGTAYNGYSVPIGDIEFNQAGNKILLGESPFYSGVPLASDAHKARVLEYTQVGTTWSLETPYSGENYKYMPGQGRQRTNSRGGVAWAYESVSSGNIVGRENFVVMTSDQILTSPISYGIQFTPTTGGNWQNSMQVDGDGDVGDTNEKGIYGDIDIYFGISCVKPTAITLSQTNPTCTNNNGKITFTSVTGADKYFINIGASSTGSYATATTLPTTGADIQSNIPNTGGTYTVRFFNGTNDCYEDQTITIAAVTCACTALSALSATATPSSLATGSSSTLNVTGTGITAGVTTFAWAGTGGFTATTQNPSTGALATAGGYSYTVTVTNANGTGTCTATATTSLTVSTAAVACTNTVTTICNTQTITLTAQTGLLNVQWYKDGTAAANAIAGATNNTYTTGVAGIYYYKAQDNTGCELNLCCGVQIIVNTCATPCTALSALTATATPSSLASGSSSTLNVIGTGITAGSGTPPATTFSWSGGSAGSPGGFTATTQNPSTGAIATAGGYSYTVTATNANGTGICTATATTSLTVSTAVATCTAPTFSGATLQVTCNGTTPNIDAKLTISAITNGDKVAYSTGATYTGTATYSTATLISTLSPAGTVVGNLVNPAANQQYTIRVYNASNTCYTDQTITLTNKICTCPTPSCASISVTRIR